MTIEELVRKISNENYGLVLFKKPSDSKISLLFGKVTELKDLSDIESKEGFIFHPFDIEEERILLIENDLLENKNIFSFGELVNALRINYSDINSSIDSSTYFQKINSIITKIKSGALDKAILSIQKQEHLKVDFEYFFEGRLDVFRYIFLTKKIGWIGASPEKFLTKKDKEIRTHSLAGTRKKTEDNFWQEKESKEQEIVTNAIKQVFKSHNVQELETSLQNKLTFGNLEHILNRIKGNADAKTNIFELLKSLHPTPAVGTFPLENSIEIIKKTEGVPRKYYTGFFGLWNNENDFDFYVNLRCLEILKSKYLFYAGGGITEGSNSQAEWEEANNKIEAFKQYLVEE